MTHWGSAPELGRIEVEVPHWAAAVTVCDPQLRPLVELDTVRENPAEPGVFEAVGAVPAGIYQVEVTLGGQRQRELVGVSPGQTARIGQQTWRLEFTSVAPLGGRDHPLLAAQRATAEDISRGPAGAGASSRLFLFVRTMDPERFPRFADGLYLLDADHRPVVDIDAQARTNRAEGWRAFAGELPAGYYVLRRGRPGVPVRYQPIHLSAGWDTQVFLAARGYPSLRKLSMAMLPGGTGFRADDETVMATETLLAGLDAPGHETPILTNRKLLDLLSHPHENPWLDVVAAYSVRGRLRSGDPSDGVLTDLLSRLVDSASRIADHPDVRALHLDDDAPADQPFPQPPLLRAALARVSRHATRYAATIPLDCLTDCVLDNVVTNSMWTAWHTLDRRPRPALPTSPGAPGPIIDIRRAPGPPPLTALGRPPAATTLRLLASSDSSPAVADDPAESAPTSPTADRLLLAPLVRAAEELIAVHGFSALPDRVPLSPARDLDDELARTQPAEVSAASGLPLARTEDGVKQLRRRLADDLDPTSPTATDPLPAAQREIVRYVLRNSGAAPGSDDPAPGPVGPPAPDDVVAGLRAEEDRLRRRSDDEEWASGGGDPETARELADRLQRVADGLLKGADFVALTVPGQRLILGNLAFEDLVGQSADTSTGQVRTDERGRTLSAWDRELARQATGHSVLVAPAANRIATEWELQRSALVDADDEPHAWLNVLRGSVTTPSGPVVEHARTALADVRMYASLYAYGSDVQRGEYAERLRAVTESLASEVTGV